MVTSEWPSPERPYGGCFIEQQAEALRRAGVSVEVLPFAGRRRVLNYLRAWRQVRKAINGGGFDLVHAQFGHSGALSVTPKKIPVVIQFRGSDLQGGRLWRAVSRYGARKADANIVVARRMGAYLPRPPDAVIPSGIDFDLFRPIPREQARARLGLPQAGKLVLFVGGPDRRAKRHRLAKEAVGMVPGATLLSVSGVDRTTIPFYMNAADALILVSLWEGSPNVVKEALACNLPVVATDVGDIRERIESVAGCCLCEGDSPEEIARAVVDVLSRDARVDGRDSVRGLADGQLAQQVIAVYREVLRGVGGGTYSA